MSVYLRFRRRRLPAAFLFFFFFIGPRAFAQDKAMAQYRLSVDIRNRSFPEALAIIESRIPLRFAYSMELVRRQENVTLTATDIPLRDLLDRLLLGRQLSYRLIGHQIVLEAATKPARVVLSGFVRDAHSGEYLAGASVIVPILGIGVVTNAYGFYSLTIPASDSLQMAISYIGYQREELWAVAGANQDLSIVLERDLPQENIHPLTFARDKREDNIKKTQAAALEIPRDMAVEAPSAGGGGDLINAVELLPGIQAGMDGSPGYFVRGGNAGQNLILLDDATLYNPSHIFGPVSIFHTPVIQRANLLKEGFPASYGDHLSSVLDVVMKDGSNQQVGGNIDLGSVAAGATVYGPVSKGESSYLLSARRSTADWLLHPLLKNNYFNNYYFYDVNAKVNFTLSPKDRLLLSFYTGRDNNQYSTDSANATGIDYSMHFGNTMFAARWNHQYSGKLFSNTSVEYNRYHQFLSATQNGYIAQLYSGIRDVHVKTNFSYYLSPQHTLGAGADYLYQTLYPASLSGTVPGTDSSGGIIPGDIPAKTASRVALYASDDMRLGQRVQVYAGVRVPVYYSDGARYLSVEPRLAFSYLINAATSVKVSYTLMHQYLHLVQSYNASFPAEIWIGSGPVIRPESSNEVAAGLFRNFRANTWQTSVEFYYRRLGNQLLFGGGTTPTVDNAIENEVVFGKGWGYGAEFFVRKNRGRWTGTLAYSLAYARQRFDSLNLGQSFPYAFDRRHLLDLSGGYALDAHWRVAANFVLASGRAFTLDTDTAGVQVTGGNPLYPSQARGRAVGRGRNQDTVSTFGIKTNNYRLEPYDRLDLSLRYRKTRNTRRGSLETEWIFAVYNVYGRRNSSLVYRTIDPATRRVEAKEIPFIPVIPSITYKLTF